MPDEGIILKLARQLHHIGLIHYCHFQKVNLAGRPKYPEESPWGAALSLESNCCWTEDRRHCNRQFMLWNLRLFKHPFGD